ncbi:aromatic ring-hydroxylating oxygenase subunit alpha [Sphingomonas sp.]|uniref:aromatic ring-hydroxylating oxygenase subunit alpha n=1 Tax=Sphingomonas sp. TaxID=28214 RepID=UPI002FC68016
MEQTEHKRFSQKFPELGTDPIPVANSVSPEFFAKEKERIFKRSWINVGRAEELRTPGDYIVKRMDMWDTSILLVRGRDGELRAFHNVCQHRGNLLVGDSEKGNCKGFLTCKFHGWVYDDSGKLRDVPDEENFHNLDKAVLGLKPIALDTWLGFIFVNLRPEQSLTEYLGGYMGEKLNAYPFDRLETFYTYKPDEAVNWKVLLDAQQEGYHVPSLHKRTLSLSFPKEFVRFRSHDMIIHGPHRILSAGSNAGEFVPTPVGAVASKIGANSIDAFAGAAGGDMSAYADAMHGVFDFNLIFPNFVIGLLYGTYFTYNIWPVAVNRSIWEIRMYYPKARTASQAFTNEYGKVAFRDGLMEDASVHEATQRGIESGAIENFQFQDEEILCRHGHLTVQRMVNG